MVSIKGLYNVTYNDLLILIILYVCMYNLYEEKKEGKLQTSSHQRNALPTYVCNVHLVIIL